MLIVLREDLTASNIALVSSWPSNTNMSDSEPDYDMVRSETWDFPVDPGGGWHKFGKFQKEGMVMVNPPPKKKKLWFSI